MRATRTTNARRHAAALTRDGELKVMAADAPRKPLVVVGSANADLVLRVDRLPAPGETVGASSLEVFPGGKVCRGVGGRRCG